MSSTGPLGRPVGEPRHVALVGMMGAGKSAVGSALAGRLGRQFADTDSLIESATGSTVRDVLTGGGEQAFRDLEVVILDAALGVVEPAVIGCGGGVVTTPFGRRLLTDGRAFVVWLRARPSTLVDRLVGAADRPLLDGGVEEAVGRLLVERAGWYGEVADVIVDVDDRSVSDVVHGIIEVGELVR